MPGKAFVRAHVMLSIKCDVMICYGLLTEKRKLFYAASGRIAGFVVICLPKQWGSIVQKKICLSERHVLLYIINVLYYVCEKEKVYMYYSVYVCCTHTY